MGIVVKPGRGSEPCNGDKEAHGVDEVEVKMQVQKDYKYAQAPKAHHVQTCLNLNQEEKQCEEGGDHNSEEEVIEFWIIEIVEYILKHYKI